MTTDSLIDSVRDRRFSEAQRLIEAGADIHEKDHEGKTALHFAAIYADTELITSLLHKGAHVDAVDSQRCTPLLRLCATMEQDADAVCAAADLLLSNGASLSAKEMWGRTPMEEAVFQRRYYLIDVFSRHGAQPKVSTDEVIAITERIRESGHTEATTREVRAEVECLLRGEERLLELGRLVRNELERSGHLAPAQKATAPALSPDTPWKNAKIPIAEPEVIVLLNLLDWQDPDNVPIGQIYDRLKTRGGSDQNTANLTMKIASALGED